jgi:hypothetical protein
MNKDYSLPIDQWKNIFKDFNQVEKVEGGFSSDRLDIYIRGRGNIFTATIEELDDLLYKFNCNPHEVVTSFLRKHGILIYYQNTLVGYFDIQAYSDFIRNTSIDEAVEKVKDLFSRTKSISNTDAFAVKFDHWILSDSIILVVDTNRHPIFSGSLEYFLGTCSIIMKCGMEQRLPLRGAIGGGNFYKDGEIMVSSALVDAALYEKSQKWLGAVLTPSAIEIIEKAKSESEIKGKNLIDLYSDKFNSFVRHGVIPWSDSNQNIKKPSETFYIKPFDISDKNWASNYLPDCFDKQEHREKIENSNCLYGEG